MDTQNKLHAPTYAAMIQFLADYVRPSTLEAIATLLINEAGEVAEYKDSEDISAVKILRNLAQMCSTAHELNNGEPLIIEKSKLN